MDLDPGLRVAQPCDVTVREQNLGVVPRAMDAEHGVILLLVAATDERQDRPQRLIAASSALPTEP